MSKKAYSISIDSNLHDWLNDCFKDHAKGFSHAVEFLISLEIVNRIMEDGYKPSDKLNEVMNSVFNI